MPRFRTEHNTLMGPRRRRPGPSSYPGPSLSNPISRKAKLERLNQGFGKFPDGMLNVEPVRNVDMRMFQENQTSSPLLQLPAELRYKIWEYTVGGHEIQYSMNCKGSPFTSSNMPLCEGKLSVAPGLKLLRVCRQIYAEAATLPFRCNTFLFEKLYHVPDMKLLRMFQWSNVLHIELYTRHHHCDSMPFGPWVGEKALFLQCLPAVRHIVVRFETSLYKDQGRQAAVRRALESLMGDQANYHRLEVSFKRVAKLLKHFEDDEDDVPEVEEDEEEDEG